MPDYRGCDEDPDHVRDEGSPGHPRRLLLHPPRAGGGQGQGHDGHLLAGRQGLRGSFKSRLGFAAKTIWLVL